jgi:nucleoside-diphosphate-sugar epimerase
MKRVLITGATGFIGANLARRLLTDGHEIHLLARPGYSRWRIQNIRKDADVYEVDLRDTHALEEVVRQIRPDWVFHLATSGAYSWQTDLSLMVQTNIVGTINLVEACSRAGYEAFVNTGSSSEYGFKQSAPSETEWLEPNSQYAVTKASASLYCRHVAQNRKVPLRTLRLYSVFGPYEETRRLVPSLIREGLKGKLPPLVGPETSRDYIYVDDVIDAYLLTASKPNQELGAIYNIGSGIQTSLREMVQTARQTLGIPAEPEWNTMPQRTWDTNIWVANIRRAVEEFDWYPRFNLQQVFLRTVQWFSENPEYLQLAL